MKQTPLFEGDESLHVPEFLKEKVAELGHLFDIVDEKYAIEGELRNVTAVKKWVRAEIFEVLEAVAKKDYANRLEEIVDFLYVLYAHMKWRTKRSQEQALRIFLDHPSYVNYLNQLSVEDISRAVIKFRERNVYLQDTEFLESLKHLDTKAERLDAIDRYWDQIKYKEQKGFTGPHWPKTVEIAAGRESPEADELQSVLSVLRVSSPDVAHTRYIDKILSEAGMPEPWKTYAIRSFTEEMNYHGHNLRYKNGLQRYIDSCEIYISHGFAPLDALICASLQNSSEWAAVYTVNRVAMVLVHTKGYEEHVAKFVASILQPEAFLFIDAVKEGGWDPLDQGFFLLQHYVSFMQAKTETNTMFYRMLRAYVGKNKKGYYEARKNGMSPEDIVKDALTMARKELSEARVEVQADIA